MKKTIILCAILGLVACNKPQLVNDVNMFMGVDVAGNTVIGPRMPYGSSHPSPNSKEGAGDGYSQGKPIYGFSQLHASGAGGNSHYGNILLSPQIGLSVLKDGHLSNVSNEKASPYMYQCFLNRYKINAQVVPTNHGAIYNFTFPKSDSASILIDCSHSIPETIIKDSDYGAEQGEVTVETDSTIIGWGQYKGGWLFAKYKVYFALHISNKAAQKGVFIDSVKLINQFHIKSIKPGNRLGAWFMFGTQANQQVKVRIAVSTKSIENAKQFLKTELLQNNFEQIKATAQQTWENELNKIYIKGGTVQQRQLFYSNLMRTMLTPCNRTGDSPLYNTSDAYYDDQFCVWDTWRTVFPLMLLINPDHYKLNIQSFIKRFEVNRRVDDAFVTGIDAMPVDPNFRQGGDDVTNIIADGYEKQVKGINWNKAYEIVKNQADSMRWPSYINEHKMHFGEFRNPASTQLEFCYNDFLASQMAKQLGFVADAQLYAKRATSWEYYWNTSVTDSIYNGFIQNRLPNGAWELYDVRKKDLNGPHFYEGSAWVYSYFVPHNFARLIELCGGNEKYAERLNFALQNNLIDYSNEPSFMTIRSFIDAGRPDLCSYWVYENMKKFSLSSYPGDDDSGAMSAWYVFSALGIFPNAGTNEYYLNAPLFPYSEIWLPEGKNFKIIAKNAGNNNIYINSAKLNGKALLIAKIKHAHIINGGLLELILSNKPSNWGK